MMLSRAEKVVLVIGTTLIIGFFARPFWEPRIFGAVDGTAAGYDKAASKCLAAAQFECAEKNWEQYLKMRPNDASAWAKLGIARNQRDDHEAAIGAFEHAISLGEGTYDLFGYYADSLAKVGRTEDAVTWYYRALAVVPSLVDVRGKLAKLLVLQKKNYEALSLLESFDLQLQVKGHRAYFEGQRIAIESAIERNEPTDAAEKAIRLPKYEGHFYAPVKIGSARPEAFVVDTGASVTVLDEAKLAQSKTQFRSIQSDVLMKTADGRIISAKSAVLDSLSVGPYVLKDVSVVTCKGCVSLLGQSTLSRFDLKSSRVNDVEFLTLSLRR